MSQESARILAHFVIPSLGAILFLVINPQKIGLGWRLLALLACSLWCAPFVFLVLALRREESSDWSADVLPAFAFGPLFLLWLAGLQAIGLIIRALYRSLLRVVSSATGRGSAP